MTRFSILDQGPVAAAGGPARAVRDSVELARRAEALGFARYWIAEHHATPSRAIAAPEVLVARIASATSRIRVGTGGVMLPNHTPLHVVEQFRALEALFPGRVDLGVGRSTGSPDDRVAAALARGPQDPEGFAAALRLLLRTGGVPVPPAANGGATGGGTEDEPLSAQPGDAPLPPVYFLGASSASGETAAALGLPFAISAGFRPPESSALALRHYRERYVPARPGDRPWAILVVRAWVGEDDEHAEALAEPERLANVRQLAGAPEALGSVAEALAHRPTETERRIRAGLDLRSDVVGGRERVERRLRQLITASAADEVMVVTNTPDPEERADSYRRLAEAVAGLTGADATADAGAGAVPAVSPA
jgi:luciferase family oxidoreductase group 1